MSPPDELTDRPADVAADSTADLAFDVPSDATPAECRYCGQPFADADVLALHRGFEHADRLDEAERAAFEAAYERESDELRLYRLKTVGVIVVLYFGLLMTYALVG